MPIKIGLSLTAIYKTSLQYHMAEKNQKSKQCGKKGSKNNIISQTNHEGLSEQLTGYIFTLHCIISNIIVWEHVTEWMKMADNDIRLFNKGITQA